MTGRERVYRTLACDHPDRVPRQLWTLPAAAMEHGQETLKRFRARFPSDFAGAAGAAKVCLTRGNAYEVGTFTDEWGCTFINVQRGIIGEVKEPLVEDWSRLELVRPPEALLNIDVAEANRSIAATDGFVIAGCCPRPFERLQFLRGSENVYLDLAEEPPEFFDLLQRVHGYYLKELEVWSRTGVDCLTFMDDWGSQRSLLISPAQWRRVFKPLYQQYCDLAHAAGKKIFMHSDGYIADIYEDLIEIGVDAVNSQLFIMDIEEIGRRYAGQITFWGEIDRQHLLSHGTPEQCRQAVQRVAANLMRGGGGVIAQFEYGGTTRPENAEAVFEEWNRISTR